MTDDTGGADKDGLANLSTATSRRPAGSPDPQAGPGRPDAATTDAERPAGTPQGGPLDDEQIPER
ncbi:MAG: hypothetical protein PGN34_04380 [Methylobacterium frigidaeris]